ncbi:hypothetical protein PENSPDRAFT_718183 [Peniophora sp. CONT]|nr:hypothetical protein PENSPDRAFT_718183 [Peniophora sp. CONT]
MVFSPSSRWLALRSIDNVTIWDLNTDRKVHHATLPGNSSAIALSNNHIAIAAHSSVRVYDHFEPNILGKCLSGHDAHIVCLAYSSDGTCLMSGHDDGTISVWDTESLSEKLMNNNFDNFTLPNGYGWLRGPYNELLLYVPPGYRHYVQHLPCKIRVAQCQLTINWDGAVHGKDWTKCYVGPEFITPETYPIQL